LFLNIKISTNISKESALQAAQNKVDYNSLFLLLLMWHTFKVTKLPSLISQKEHLIFFDFFNFACL